MFSWLGFVILLGAIGTSSYYRLQARRCAETIARRQEGVALLGIRVGVAALLLFPVVGCMLIPQKMVWASLTLPFWCRWLGVIVGVSTIPAIAWVLHSLGQNVSETVLTKRNHHLVTAGPYRWVRHPLYSAGIALFLALSLIDSSWLILLIAVIVAAFLQVLVIPLEEQALLTKFGDDYRAYTRSTGRFLPRVVNVSRSVHALTLIALLSNASDARLESDREKLGSIHFPISCSPDSQRL